MPEFPAAPACSCLLCGSHILPSRRNGSQGCGGTCGTHHRVSGKVQSAPVPSAAAGCPFTFIFLPCCRSPCPPSSYNPQSSYAQKGGRPPARCTRFYPPLHQTSAPVPVVDPAYQHTGQCHPPSAGHQSPKPDTGFLDHLIHKGRPMTGVLLRCCHSPTESTASL